MLASVVVHELLQCMYIYYIASLLVNLDCTGCNREHHGKVEKHRSPKNNDLTEQTGDVKEVEPQTTLNRQSCGSESLDYMPANHFFRSVRMYRGCVLHVVQYMTILFVYCSAFSVCTCRVKPVSRHDAPLEFPQEYLNHGTVG